ncbi:MAG: MFS transporter [Terracidiphilus sp.]
MRAQRTMPPVWLVGFANITLGLTNGIVFFVMPQLLAAQHVSEATIASVTAAAMSANFWAVLFSPILDVRFSRRWYATATAALAALFVVIAFTNLQHIVLLSVALVLIVCAAGLSAAALGGWLSSVCPHSQKNNLSAWLNVVLIGGTGLGAAAGAELVRHLGAGLAAALLGACVVLPTVLFLFIPAPGPDRRLAGESFAQFNREILAMLRRRNILIVLLLFLSPCSTFALTSLLGAFGADFHASAGAVSMAGGAGAVISGIIGSLLFPVIARRAPLRFLYLGNGILGAVFTLLLIAIPRAPWAFTLALLGLYLFQALAFSIQLGIVFEAIGPDNPLASTTFAFLTAATNVPVTYMMVIDGRGYTLAGITGSFATDAFISIATCLLLGLLFVRLGASAFAPATPAIETAD